MRSVPCRSCSFSGLLLCHAPTSQLAAQRPWRWATAPTSWQERPNGLTWPLTLPRHRRRRDRCPGAWWNSGKSGRDSGGRDSDSDGRSSQRSTHGNRGSGGATSNDEENPGDSGPGPHPGDGQYDGTGGWQDLPGTDEWERWRRSWSADPLDDSWAETTRDLKPKGFSVRLTRSLA